MAAMLQHAMRQLQAGAAYLKAGLEQLHRLLATDGDGGGDLLVTADGEGAHGVARLAVHGLLAGKLLQDLEEQRAGVTRVSISPGWLSACCPDMTQGTRRVVSTESADTSPKKDT